jgi:hypothetical protein
MRIGTIGLVLMGALLSASGAKAQVSSPSSPQVVSLCDILKDPKAYDHRNVQFRGDIISEFEDFTVYDSACPGKWGSGVWLMFGGDIDCPTPSTVNDRGRPKGKNVRFDGVEYPLVKDDNFELFHRSIIARQNMKSVYKVSAILEGTFTAGMVEDKHGHKTRPGYGHMGCCHLFIIHQISDVKVSKQPTA